MSETTPSPENQPSNIDAALSALEMRVTPRGTSMVYNPEECMVARAGIRIAEAVSQVVEVDVEDPRSPGSPILYDAAFFTKGGSEKYGLRAQLVTDVTKADDEYPSELVYQIRNDNTMQRIRRRQTIVGRVIDEQRDLLQPEVDEIVDQLLTLGLTNDQRKIPTIFK